jgi:hypothetical protein
MMRQWMELISLTFVELVLKLYPMEPKIMQEALHDIHEHEDKESDSSKHEERSSHL